MTKYILSIDPGVSTGIALIGYAPDSYPTLEGAWQFTGGAEALKQWVLVHFQGPSWGWNFGGRPHLPVTVTAEKFTARNTRGFAYTTASLEPLRGEGVLIALDLMPDYIPKKKRWTDPRLQYLVGGKDLADKKKRQHAFLKANGFYKTGKDFGTPDADDFRSAAAHGIAYLARELHHKPTFELLSIWEG